MNVFDKDYVNQVNDDAFFSGGSKSLKLKELQELMASI